MFGLQRRQIKMHFEYYLKVRLLLKLKPSLSFDVYKQHFKYN